MTTIYCQCADMHHANLSGVVDITLKEYLQHTGPHIFIRRADCTYLENNEEVLCRNDRFFVVVDHAMKGDLQETQP